jgi:XTP/dITP diphosphohydrolase
MKLVVATKNQHKIKEILHILGNDLKNIEIVSLNDYPDAPEVIEDGKTFEENASKKALEMAAFTGETVIADDSGLEVDALNGEPGVYSARYAGEGASYQQLCEKLLGNMKDIPQEKRSAKFTTVIAIAKPNELIGTVRGECKGFITDRITGNDGFGYDPVFYYPPLKKTFAELSPGEKNSISHRYRSLLKLKQLLPDALKL